METIFVHHMGIAPAMQIGELRSREPVRVRPLDIVFTQRSAEPVQRLQDAGGEQMIDWLGTSGINPQHWLRRATSSRSI